MNISEESPSQTTPQPGPSYAQHAPPQTSVTHATDPRRKSPVLACMLSMMPGLGQVYVGYYQRGFIHAIVVAILITVLASNSLLQLTPLVAIFLAFFGLYNIIDAGRRATLYNQVLAGGSDIELPEDFKSPTIGGSIFGGLALLVIGFVMLLNTRFGVSLEWLEEWWPAIVMIFGAYLLMKALKERSTAQQDIQSEDSSDF